jgi:3-oxoacyl-[acyl-carrier protein] reductase
MKWKVFYSIIPEKGQPNFLDRKEEGSKGGPMIHLKGKKALITGGSRGIGRAVAFLFAQSGADVAINYASRSNAAEEVRKKIIKLGRKCTTLKANVSLKGEVDEMVGKIIEKWG